MSHALQQLALVISLALFHLVGPVPADLGLHGGSLSACASSAHCARVDWAVNDPQESLAALRETLLTMPRTEIVQQTADYLHATSSSALFGFVDDVELHADSGSGVLQARSVSRLGDSDLGVNARRLAALAAALPS